MATASWSWSTTSTSNNNTGNSWLNYSLSGTALPSGAIITDIKYNLMARVGSYSSNSKYIFRLYSIAIENGPYTNASYDSSASTSYVSFSAATTKATSSSNSRPPSDYTTQPFENGNAYVWRYSSSRTCCELEGCDFVDRTIVSAFFNDIINLRVKLNSNFSGTTYIMGVTVTVTYDIASLTTPTNLSIVQHPTDGTYTLSWDAAIGTNGTGSVTYQIWDVTNGSSISEDLTTTSYTANVPGYDYFFEYQVYAFYSGLVKYSSKVGSYFYPPSITSVPDLLLLSQTGDSATLTWTNPSIEYGTASSYDYTIYYSTPSTTNTVYTTLVTESAGTKTLTIPSSWFDANIKNNEPVTFALLIAARISSYVADPGYSIRTIMIRSAPFTYDGKSTVGYYDGSSWKECVIYYYNGSNWIECVPYYYDGSIWQALKTKT